MLGCLLEKQQATPEYYPLTLNALVAACNQKSNRDPVMDLAEADVRGALDRLRAEVLVWPVEGARAERWEHNLDRSWELDAVLQGAGDGAPAARAANPGGAPLAVRAAAPVRVRSARSRRRSGGLAAGPEPLVAELPRGAGQKESRWTHLAAGAPAERAEPAPAPRAPSGAGLAERVAALEERVAELAGELSRLAAKLGDKI